MITHATDRRWRRTYLLFNVPAVGAVDRDAPSDSSAGLRSGLAAAVQYARFALHAHFNHNDLYHVIQIAAMTLFYNGGKLMRDRQEQR